MNKPVCVVQGPVQTRSGYGDHARDIVRSLIKYGKYDVKLVPMPWGSCPKTALDSDTEENKDLKSRFVTQLSSQPDIHIQISIPNEFQPQGKYNIGITAGIETTLCRGEWIEGLNRMDLNIVPSHHSKNVFTSIKFKKKLKTGQETDLVVSKPLEVLFEGSDTKIYSSKNKIAKSVTNLLSDIPEEFCFLFVGHWMQGRLGSDRKDVGMLIKTFSEVFKNQKNAPALVLKSSGASFSEVDKNELLGKIASIQGNIAGDLPNVYLIHGEFTDDEINSLYNHPKVKSHVSFTHGEGYGRPLQEASLSGKPVVCSNWSGPQDFLDKDLAVLLPGEVKPLPSDAVNEWLVKESSWFNVNYSAAAQVLIDIHKNYDKYLSKSKKLAKKNEVEFSLDKMDTDFATMLDKYVPEMTVSQPINLPKLKKMGSQEGLKLPKLKKK